MITYEYKPGALRLFLLYWSPFYHSVSKYGKISRFSQICPKMGGVFEPLKIPMRVIIQNYSSKVSRTRAFFRLTIFIGSGSKNSSSIYFCNSMSFTLNFRWTVVIFSCRFADCTKLNECDNGVNYHFHFS